MAKGAKVWSKTFRVDGKDWRCPFQVTSKGQFFVSLPEKMGRILEGDKRVHWSRIMLDGEQQKGKIYEVVGDTLQVVEQAMESLIHSYHELQKNVERVILFKLKCNVYRMEEGVCVVRKNEIAVCDGVALALWWELGERRMQSSGHVGLYGARGGYCREDEVTTIPWTAEREAFFEQLEENLTLTILKALRFFEQKPAEIASQVDSKVKLLPAPEGK